MRFLPARLRTRAAALSVLGLAAVAGGIAYWHMTHPVTHVRLLTEAVPVLPPHAHELKEGTVDSVFDPGHGKMVSSKLYIAPRDMWITDLDVAVAGAPTTVLHHLILFKLGAPNPHCPGLRDQELFTLGADSPAHTELPAPYGIFLKKGEGVYLYGMVHNPEPPRGPGDVYYDVSIGLDLTVEGGDTRNAPVRFVRLFLDDKPFCDEPTLTEDNRADVFTVPPRSESFVKSADLTDPRDPATYTFKEPGLVLGMGAHMHPMEGGKQVDVFLNEKHLYTFTPQHIPPDPWTWLTSGRTFAFPVKPGDVLSISSVYTNPHDLPMEDAMGQVVIFFSPERSAK